ncbi:RtcB family protein [Limisalsivibrio acetivorans]|uniref:RtcB family protein n=1 Tax=Limisalsivibrio acetivorans TaxID=1304888 RepID=UPI0003B78574|nr:RtcB family protein [Limisalsivibrio acetivorans]
MNDERYAPMIPQELIEETAQKQIDEWLTYPFVKRFVILPDVHAGYHMPIGGAALLDKGIISPSAVGYDIGCGMCCAVTDIDADTVYPEREPIFREITSRIPTGFDFRKKGLDYKEFRSASGDRKLDKKVKERLYVQLGTLGGGNHFIELGPDRDNKLCITIHSGSRNPGHSIGGYYMKLSKDEDTELPTGFLNLNRDTGRAYRQDMDFILQYALDNRLMMIETVKEILGITDRNIKTFINENHNHAETRGDGVLHRKGATPAEKGQLGVIPGNMRDGVYITEGLGNEEFLSSASHGAGRIMGRKEAKKKLSLDRFKKHMEGIVSFADRARLDESPDAYKDIAEVLSYQEGIVIKTINSVRPFLNIKG